MRSSEKPGKGSFAHALSFGGLTFAANVLLGIVTSIAIARTYGIDIVGQYALVLAPTTALWSLSTLGERTALQRELAVLDVRDRRITGLLVAVMTFSFALTTAVGAAAMAIVYFLYRGPIGQPQLVLPAMVSFLGYLVAQNTSWTLDTVLNAARAGKELFSIRLAQQVSYLLLAISFGLIWGTIWALTAATVIPSFGSLFRRLRVLRRYMTWRISREEVRAGFASLPRMVKFGLKLAPGGIANGVSGESATWILGATVPIASLGAYSRAAMLGQRLRDLNRTMHEVLLPTLVERLGSGDAAGFDRATVDSARYVVVLTTLAASAGGGAAYGVMELFGPGFGQAAPALAILLLMAPVVALVQVQSQVLLAHDRPALLSKIIVTRAVLGLPLSLGLILVAGITGAAAGLVIGDLAVAVCLAVFVRPYMREAFSRLWPLRQIVALLFAYVAGFAAARFVDGALPSLVGLLGGLACGGAIFVATFVVLGGVGERDRTRLAALSRRLRARRQGALPASPVDATK